MSDITIHIPPYVIIAWVMGEAALYAGLPVLIVACVILAVPGLRVRRFYRRFAFGLIGIVAVCAVPLVGDAVHQALDSLQREASTYRPDRPTMIAGLPLIGAFELGDLDGERTVEAGLWRGRRRSTAFPVARAPWSASPRPPDASSPTTSVSSVSIWRPGA